MATHLRTMHREARSQAKERTQPQLATPHKVLSRAAQAAVKEMSDKFMQNAPRNQHGK